MRHSLQDQLSKVSECLLGSFRVAKELRGFDETGSFDMENAIQRGAGLVPFDRLPLCEPCTSHKCRTNWGLAVVLYHVDPRNG